MGFPADSGGAAARRRRLTAGSLAVPSALQTEYAVVRQPLAEADPKTMRPSQKVPWRMQ
jgi:hypothetical protein